MRSSVLVLLMTAVSSATFAQIDFERGYYIDNTGNRIECLIKNVDWENNPTRFVIKKHAQLSTQEITIEDAQEFSILGKSHYVRAAVDVDRSNEKIDGLSSMRAPEFRNEQVFLKALVEGKANLYAFTDGIRRFYYQTDTSSIQPLVYKQYRYNGAILENLTFRQQLYNVFRCATPDRSDVDRARYSQRDLAKLFNQYNTCVQSPTTDYTKRQSKDFFNLWLRPRVTLSSLAASRGGVSSLDVQFENQLSFSGGIEAEFMLPFNENKWAITVETIYQSYDASIPSEPIKVDYQAVEIPIGLRYYFFLNENSKISVSGAFQLALPFKSKITHFSNVELEISSTASMAFEAGYVLKNRFCIAYRIQTHKELVGKYAIWASEYSTMALVLGYSMF